MSADLRLKGQEVTVKITRAGSVVTEINSIGSFNDNVMLEIKQDGFLGEAVDRFDEVLGGYGGDFEIQHNTARWHELVLAIESRARREQPDLVFNVIRTDFYANGETAVITFIDVKWGAVPRNLSGRAEYDKAKFEFKTSEKDVQINALL